MLYEFKVVPNSALSQAQYKDIAALKNQYWIHTINSQITWIKEHYGDSDRHIIAYEGSSPVAYAGLVCRECQMNNVQKTFLGVGNVCVEKEKRGTGLGRTLIGQVNEILKLESEIGLLLCHDNLVAFYKKCGWLAINFAQCNVESRMFYGFVMGFNIAETYYKKLHFEQNF